MKLSAQLFLVVVALAGAGCKSGHSIVGKWTVADPGGTQNYEFMGDNKMTVSGDTKTPIAMTLNVTGTYTLDKDTLNLKATDVTIKTADPAQQKLIDAGMAKGKQEALDQMNKDGANGKMVWKTDDSFDLTDAKNKVLTFNRAKS